jgi:hypothetical protein
MIRCRNVSFSGYLICQNMSCKSSAESFEVSRSVNRSVCSAIQTCRSVWVDDVQISRGRVNGLGQSNPTPGRRLSSARTNPNQIVEPPLNFFCGPLYLKSHAPYQLVSTRHSLICVLVKCISSPTSCIPTMYAFSHMQIPL